MIDFDIARTWHRIFTQNLEFIAAGLMPPPPTIATVRDDSACTLGQWLHGAGASMKHAQEYADLMELHRKFHQVAGQYLESCLEKHDGQACCEAEAALQEASAQVVGAIDSLKDAVDQQGISCTSQFANNGAQQQIEWDGSLALGLPAIDQQHQALVGILNKLMSNPHESLHSQDAVDNLSELTRLLDFHFASEEAYMRQLEMPEQEMAEHHRKHQEMMQQCVDLNLDSFRNRDLKVCDIAAKISQWAIDHVVEYDFKIREYLPDGHSLAACEPNDPASSAQRQSTGALPTDVMKEISGKVAFAHWACDWQQAGH